MKRIEFSEIQGEVFAPSSKSMMIRAAAAALLREGTTRIHNPTVCGDGLGALQVIEALGADYRRRDQILIINGGLKPRASILNCNESGLCIRLFTPVAALQNKMLTITGTGSLKSRPMEFMEAPLRSLGAICMTNNGFAPIRIKGPLKSGRIEIDGSLSSQFITGLLMTLPLCEGDSIVTVKDPTSRPYITMTLNLLKDFGVTVQSEPDYREFHIPGNQVYSREDYRIEGDWSGASFLLVAGALAGRVSIRNLREDSAQADKKILEALETCGAVINRKDDSIEVEHSGLRSFDFDATECPDLFPPLTALACFCQGTSRITGINRLRHKESDRAGVLLQEFQNLGADISIVDNRLEITGGSFKGGILDSHNDHRIAMAGAIAGIRCPDGVQISDWQAAAKSYPAFFKDLKSLGGRIQ